MAFKEKKFYDSYAMNGLPGNQDYIGYPYWFYPHHVFTSVKAISGLKPAHSQIIMGKTIFRRNSREYQLPSIFFNSYKSIKTVAWMYTDKYRRTPNRTDYSRCQHFFWYQPATRRRKRSPGLLFISPSRNDFNRKETENRYRRAAYNSYFSKPLDVPTPSFSPDPEVISQDGWTEVQAPTTVWTTRK